MRGLYYSPQGEPMEMMEWAELFESRFEDMAPESWWRKQSVLDDQLNVSTVWIGIDQSFGLAAEPQLWETMIFGGEHDDCCWRYPSRVAALDDHERILTALRAGKDPREATAEVQ